MSCPLKLHVRPAITNMNDEQTLLLCIVKLKGNSFDNAFDIEIRISRPKEADSGEVGERLHVGGPVELHIFILTKP